MNSSEVWAGFRVGKRAGVAIHDESDSLLSATHDGYSDLDVTHQRKWCISDSGFSIFDTILSHQENQNIARGIARFHFHPEIQLVKHPTAITAGLLTLTFVDEEVQDIRIVRCDMAAGFNQLRSGWCLEIAFVKSLTTIVTINE